MINNNMKNIIINNLDELINENRKLKNILLD